jgi:hypothetical protein
MFVFCEYLESFFFVFFCWWVARVDWGSISESKDQCADVAEWVIEDR